MQQTLLQDKISLLTVAGQQNKLRIGAIIQARMQSTRLPGKVLMNLPMQKGKPLLQWLTDGLKKSRKVNSVFIATSINKKSKPITDFAAKKKVGCLAGSEKDVLSRFVKITRDNELDIVVRLTADNPFLDVQLLDELIGRHIRKGNDYTSSEGLPLGMNFEIISGSVLCEIGNLKLSEEEKEHVTLFIANSKRYKTEVVNLSKWDELSRLRLTVDYPADFALASILLGLLKKNESPDLKFIKEVYKRSPWLFETNVDKVQKQSFKDIGEEVVFSLNILRQYDLNNAAKILESAG